MIKLYQALYNSFIYESGYSTISIHRTRKGAKEALRLHKANVKTDWERSIKWHKKNKIKPVYKSFKASCRHQRWLIVKTELKD